MRYLLFGLVIPFVMSPLVVDASVVYDQFVALESSVSFDTQTLYTFVQDTDLLNGAQRFCAEEAFTTGMVFGEKLAEVIQRRYQHFSDAEMLLDSLDLWNRVHAMHRRLPRSIADDQLCIRKLLMYTLQAEFRKWHVQLISEMNLIDDFNTENPPLRAVQLKQQVLDQFLLESPVRSVPSLGFSVENPEFLLSLSRDERLLAEKSRLVMEKAIRLVFAEFLERELFTLEDVRLLQNRISLEYTDDCRAVGGKYEVRYSVTPEGERVNMSTDKMSLTVSACTKIGFILQKLHLSKLIAIHELGHHVRRYKDPDVDRFTQICRADDKRMNGRCTPRDFVSEYAQTSAEEDYAEHFQQRFINRRERPGFIDTKLRYFDRLRDE